jgi:hypothetical protein
VIRVTRSSERIGKPAVGVPKYGRSIVIFVQRCTSPRRIACGANDPASIADIQRKVPKSGGACFELIEDHLFKGRPWEMGEAHTAADPYPFCCPQATRWPLPPAIGPRQV